MCTLAKANRLLLSDYGNPRLSGPCIHSTENKCLRMPSSAYLCLKQLDRIGVIYIYFLSDLEVEVFGRSLYRFLFSNQKGSGGGVVGSLEHDGQIHNLITEPFFWILTN